LKNKVESELRKLIDEGEPVTDYQIKTHIADILQIFKGHVIVEQFIKCPRCGFEPTQGLETRKLTLDPAMEEALDPFQEATDEAHE
jgi:hypothetical protein